ncbi:MAG: hypothetical protein MJE77_13735 [Proteobacteria bacterium]|nr:hypothetical protein [Pseudomonadota bacterium]
MTRLDSATAVVALVAALTCWFVAGGAAWAENDAGRSRHRATMAATMAGDEFHDLIVRKLPSPTSLRMRWHPQARGSRLAVAQAERRAVRNDSVRSTPFRALAPDPLPGPPLSDRLTFRFNLGFGLDGGDPADQPISGYDQLRLYYFGDATISSRGLFVPSLSAYAAAQFRFDQETADCTIDKNGSSCIEALPSVQDGDGVKDRRIRSAYAQLDSFLSVPWLRPLFVRAGRQYRYGPAIAHFDGVTVGYDRSLFSLGAFTGRSVDLFASDAMSQSGGFIAGLDGRVAVYERTPVPLFISASMLRFGGVTHFQGNLALQWSRDIAIRTGLRTLGERVARTSAQVRARISEVTTVNIEVENRTNSDWMYGLYAIERPGPDAQPRNYLDLGVPLPRLYADLRAGTVLYDNIDVLIRGGTAIEHRGEGVMRNPHAATFVEGGLAVEIRPRRAVAVGLSGLFRMYERDLVQNIDHSKEVDPLPAHAGASGERSFVEGGINLRYTQGARKLTARAEFYGRYFDTQPAYAEVDFEELDYRLGGRFVIEAWPSNRLRLKASYDLSSSLSVAPDLRGFKSLRILAEGQL